jgi:uncharacterized membrane protein
MSRCTLTSVYRYLLLWTLFFGICFGLGFATLSRYEARTVPGLSDTEVYYETVTGERPTVGRAYMRSRVLVPWVAKPFYWVALKSFPNWYAVFFGLLLANSIFCAGSASLIVGIARALRTSGVIGLLGATLYLLNFALPNLQLAGLVDSGEAFFMLAVVWCLLARRWQLLPAIGLFGALAKETFVPFALVFVLTWWITAEWRGKNPERYKRLVAAIIFAIVTVATLVTLHSMMAHRIVWPWTIAAEAHERVSFFWALTREFSDHNFWYVFAWLLPLGIWKLKRFPHPWLMASVTTGLTAIALGAWKDMHGTVGRPLFNVVGPLLALSSALLLAELWDKRVSTDLEEG